MPGKATHVLGVDIGNEVLKAVELRLTSQGIEMLGVPAIMPTPRGSVAGGVIVDTNAVAEALGTMVSSGGFGTKQVVASVGGDTSCVVRIADMPRMTGKELAEAIQWELDRQTPFPVDNAIYDYQAIEHPDLPEDEQNMQVLIAVAQDEMVNAHVEALMAAKLTPVAIDIEALAISRALINSANGTYADQTVVLCNIGATNTGIYIVRKGLLNFARSIPTAGQTLTTAIRQNLAENDEQAEQFKRQFADLTAAYGGYAPAAGEPAPEAGILVEEGDLARVEEEEAVETPAVEPQPAAEATEETNLAKQEVYEAISPVVLDLATEIRRSIEYYRRQHRNEEIDRILICGGTALIPGLAEFIAGETGVVTEVANPFEHISVEQDEATAAYLRDTGALAVVATGLAMRDMID